MPRIGGGAGFARKPLGLETLAVGVERLLRGLMLAHGLLGIGAPGGISGLAFFGCQGAGAAIGEIFCHVR